MDIDFQQKCILLQKEIDRLNGQLKLLQDELSKLTNNSKITSSSTVVDNSIQPPLASKEVLKIDSEIAKSRQVEILGVANITNNINVVVKDKMGNLLDGVVGIIKNSKNVPIRAAKSNILGQIMFSNPLSNGLYFLELSKNGYKFPDIELNLDGKIFVPFEVKAI